MYVDSLVIDQFLHPPSLLPSILPLFMDNSKVLVVMVTSKYNMREVLFVGSCDTVDTSHNYLFMALP